MAVFIAETTKDYVLNALGDPTDGVIRILIYDDVGALVDSEKTILWAASSGGSMSMSSADIIFNVPAGTIVSGSIVSFYDGTLTTAITEPFEKQKPYNNAGTFIVKNVTLMVV